VRLSLGDMRENFRVLRLLQLLRGMKVLRGLKM
jgi:hypothetical protein